MALKFIPNEHRYSASSTDNISATNFDEGALLYLTDLKKYQIYSSASGWTDWIINTKVTGSITAQISGQTAPAQADMIGYVDGSGKSQVASPTTPLPITGAVTVADGADVTLGAKADTAVIDPTATASAIALLKGILTELEMDIQASVDKGTATGGSTTTLIDTARAWTTNIWAGALAIVQHGGTGYVVKVTSNTATTLTFPAIAPTVRAGDTYEIKLPISAVTMADGALTTLGLEADTASTDPTATATAMSFVKGLLKQLQGTGTGSVPASLTGSRGTIINHRVGITAADKLSTITITAGASATNGSLTNVSHGVGVAPGNLWGSSSMSALVTATPSAGKSIDVTIPQAVGADANTYYDICLSTATTAPLWVARVTEAQRAAGCAVTAVGTIGAGGSAGVVNVQVVGTGQASTAPNFAQNNAYLPATPTPIDCTGKLKAYISVRVTVTDLRSAPTLNIVPFLSRNEGSPTYWYQGQGQPVLLLTAVGQSYYQVFEVDVDSAKNLVVLVGTITGQGAAAYVDVELV